MVNVTVQGVRTIFLCENCVKCEYISYGYTQMRDLAYSSVTLCFKLGEGVKLRYFVSRNERMERLAYGKEKNSSRSIFSYSI